VTQLSMNKMKKTLKLTIIYKHQFLLKMERKFMR